jgi:3-hydroxy-9,10-secoandrosta-1,3,5(10)-triene-9,17-dione monooxygenase reductase component
MEGGDPTGDEMWSCAEGAIVDPASFRRVLGNYPTGVCVVTAKDAVGEPVGMTINSFTSASLTPPLVAFFVRPASRTWLAITFSRRFCVNVLAADQGDLSRRFAAASATKFDGVNYSLSRLGVPILDGALARIECSLQASFETGDHILVLGCVRALEAAPDVQPLVAFRGSLSAFPQNPPPA